MQYTEIFSDAKIENFIVKNLIFFLSKHTLWIHITTEAVLMNQGGSNEYP